jgi:hypothetical protein
MTTPVFLETDETAFDDDRALTAEHGRRLVRNALAVWNERCGHVGHAELLVDADGDDLSTRVVITAGWAYLGPWHYFCPSPVGTPNAARPVPTVTLYLDGRATGLTSSYVYVINQSLGAPTENQMDADVTGAGDAWAEIDAATWSATLKVRVTAGWNRIWLAVKCGTYGEPETLDFVDDETTYEPYVAEMNATGRAASSHPVLLAPQAQNADCPAKALQLATTQDDYDAGQFDLYTVPMVVRNPPVVDLQDGLFYIWEPFRDQLNRLRVSVMNQVPPWIVGGATAYPVVAYTVDIDVINLDSVYVDGSQEWALEDYQFGAALRWWQLPSASAYRNAANLAEIARRAVCPMLTWVQEVGRGTTQAEYPLPNTGGKPSTWRVASTGAGLNQISLMSLTDGLPFALPTDTVIIEVRVSVAVLVVNQRRRLDAVAVDCTIDVFNRTTFTAVASSTRQQTVAVFQTGAGSLDGFSVLARTIGYANEFKTVDERFRYGQEGLTLRGDWNNWQDVTMLIEIPRATIAAQSGAPLLLRWNVAVPSGSTDFVIARADAGVRIKGL